MQAHSTAVNSFDLNHSSYDQFRPSFNEPIVDAFLADLELIDTKTGKYDTNKKILELAAGTGKFTRSLVAKGWNGKDDNLVIVEPSSGMLETFRKNFPNITAKQGSSYSLPIEDSSVDAIVVAQGFHWFSDLESLKELNRVLKKPNGVFGCIWNFDCPSADAQQLLSLENDKINYIFEENSSTKEHFESLVKVLPNSLSKPYDISHEFFKISPWTLEVGNYVYSFDLEVPQYRRGAWRKLLQDEGARQYFTPILRENFSFIEQSIEWDSVYKLWETRSYITKLSDAEKLKIKKHIEELLTKFVTEKDKSVKEGKTFLNKALGTHTIVLKAK